MTKKKIVNKSETPPKKRPVILYRVTTCNYLPATKRIFRTAKEALSYIKKMVDKREEWVSIEQAQKSYDVIKINSSVLPEWSRIFKVNEIVKAVMPANEKELAAYERRKKGKVS